MAEILSYNPSQQTLIEYLLHAMVGTAWVWWQQVNTLEALPSEGGHSDGDRQSTENIRIKQTQVPVGRWGGHGQEVLVMGGATW